MGLQRPSLEAMVSAGHTHTTVRSGSVSSTRHSWAGEHTAETAHGFWHRCCRHESCEGQSASCVHSGMSTATAGTLGPAEGGSVVV